MIEPNSHYEMCGSHGREPGQDEQDWLRVEQDHQTSSDRAGDPYTAAVEKSTSATARARTGELEGYPWIA